MKKLLSYLLVFVMTLSMSIQVFADSETVHTITIRGDKPGHIYEAYQVFSGDLDSTGKILSNVEWGSGVDGDGLLAALTKIDAYAGCDSAADVAVVLQKFEDESEEIDLFADTTSEYLADIAGASEETDSPYTISVTGDGYYFVKDRDNANLAEGDAYTKTMLYVGGSIEVDEKADAPTLVKKVTEWGVKSDTQTANCGDTLFFAMDSVVPEMDGYDKYFFVIHDTMEGMTYEDDSMYIKVGSQVLEEADYEVITSGNEDGCSFELILKDFIQYKDMAGTAIKITYRGTLNDDAKIGNLGNTNRAHLEYSCDPNTDSSGSADNPDIPGENDKTLETPDDITVCYVTEIKLIKVDDSEDENLLDGAEFALSRPIPESLDDTDTGSVTPLSDNVGEHYFKGLSAGDYKIVETKAPDGYNLLKDTIDVHIACETPMEIVTGTEEATWKYNITGAIEQDVTVDEDGKIEIKVVNQAGATLPSTGGMGTRMFYVTGLLFMLGAAIWYGRKNRMNEG